MEIKIKIVEIYVYKNLDCQTLRILYQPLLETYMSYCCEINTYQSKLRIYLCYRKKVYE